MWYRRHVETAAQEGLHAIIVGPSTALRVVVGDTVEKMCFILS
jgi:hypothetical protein